MQLVCLCSTFHVALDPANGLIYSKPSPPPSIETSIRDQEVRPALVELASKASSTCHSIVRGYSTFVTDAFSLLSRSG